VCAFVCVCLCVPLKNRDYCVGVSIARALFSCHRSQIYLLDDPFSAVDGATGNWIFKHGLLDMLQDKLRIVVSNIQCIH
jgi:ABC-type Mn2+/Zn2+ transport system ATPase subunit